MSFCFVFNITHYGWSSLQMNCLSFAVLRYISLLFVFTLRFCRRYVLFTSNESTQDSHSTSLMEAVVSCIVSSCLRNTPWCRVDIIFLNTQYMGSLCFNCDQLLCSSLIYRLNGHYSSCCLSFTVVKWYLGNRCHCCGWSSTMSPVRDLL